MVSLPWCMVVKGLEIYNTARFASWLGLHKHSAAPLNRFINRDFLQTPEAAVSIQSSFYSFLPVEWDLCWSMYCDRFGSGVHVQSEGRATSHEG